MGDVVVMTPKLSQEGVKRLLADMERIEALPEHVIADEGDGHRITVRIDPRETVIDLRQRWSDGRLDQIILSAEDYERLMEIVLAKFGEAR